MEYYVVIGQLFIGDHGFGVFYTVWARCNWFIGVVSFPLEEIEALSDSVSEPKCLGAKTYHKFVEFENPDWSGTIPSPCNHEGLNLFTPVNYERVGFLVRDTSDDGKLIDNRDPND